jgi:hypothetical protein
MWPLIRGLWNTRRGRKAAVATIAPLVAKSRHRLDGIPERVWLDPYVIGFIMMLITLEARRAVNISDSQTLGAIQMEAWSDITEQRLGAIGEETLHLSAMEHKAFESGCENAIAFDLALYGTSAAGVADAATHRWDAALDLYATGPQQPVRASDDVMALWQHYFELHVRA